MNTEKSKEAAQRLRAIDHPIRKRMLELLQEHGEMTNTHLWVKLRLGGESIVAQHLAILRNAGMVITESRGKNSFNRINKKGIAQVASALHNFSKKEEVYV